MQQTLTTGKIGFVMAIAIFRQAIKRLCDNCRAKFISLINAVRILLFRNERDESRFTIQIFTQPLNAVAIKKDILCNLSL